MDSEKEWWEWITEKDHTHALPKYVSDHPYWGQIGLDWSVQKTITYIIFLSLISFSEWAIVQSPKLLEED